LFFTQALGWALGGSDTDLGLKRSLISFQLTNTGIEV